MIKVEGSGLQNQLNLEWLLAMLAIGKQQLANRKKRGGPALELPNNSIFGRPILSISSSQIIPPSFHLLQPSSAVLYRLLDTMKQIYELGETSFLDQNKIEELKKTTTSLYDDIQELRTRFETLNFRGRLAGGRLKIFKPTPKLHMLCAHAVQFAEQHGWWSWI